MKQKAFVVLGLVIMYRVNGAAFSVTRSPTRKLDTKGREHLKHGLHVLCQFASPFSLICPTNSSSTSIGKWTKKTERSTRIPNTRPQSAPLQPESVGVAAHANSSHVMMEGEHSNKIMTSSRKWWRISRSRIWGKGDGRFLLAVHGPLPDGVHLKSSLFSPTPSSRVRCAAHCLATQRCLAFVHSAARQECQLVKSHRLHKEQLAFDVGWKMYHV